MEIVRQTQPKKVVLVHGGDNSAIENMREEITSFFPKTQIVIPEKGIEYEI